ncbi:ABC transporter permease, partial [Streptomonospora sediminis]
QESFRNQVMGSAQTMDAIAVPEAGRTEQAEEGIPPEVLDKVRDLPEIDRAAGVTMAAAPLLDKDGQAVGSVPTLGVSVGDLSRYSAAEGELPQGDGEVALATTSADVTGYEVGDTATVLDPDGNERTFEITGLIDFGVNQEIGYRGAVAFAPQTAQQMTGTDGFAELDAIAAEGVPAQQAADAVADVTGPGTEALTGQKFGERLAEDSGAETAALTTALMLFAAISVLVAAIVIHNTFAILVAQRQREMALLRCIGAVRRQVFTSVVLEALVVGLVSSAAGVLAGIGVGYAGFTLGSGALGADTSDTVLVVAPQSVLISLAVGTAVTLIAAVLPARRATFVPPLAALRTSAVATGLDKRFGIVRTAMGTVLLLAAAGAVAFGLRADLDSDQGLTVVAGAGMVAFLGVVAISPLLVRGAVAAVSPLMRALGVSSTLAAENSRRNPRRAATAMIALTVGATLITGYSVVNASMMRTATERLDEKFPADYLVSTQFREEEPEPIPAEVAENLRAAPEIDSVLAELHAETGTDADLAFFTAYEGGDPGFEMQAGDFADVQPGSVAVPAEYKGNPGVGDTVQVTTEQGERSYEIAAVIAESQIASGVVMAPEDFAAAFPGTGGARRLEIQGAEGTSSKELRDAVLAGVEGHPGLQVDSTAQTRKQMEDILATAFLAIVAMLGLAVVIAVFGIANTLALSVLERTRESAMLRALGLKRSQLRLMLSLEAVLLCLIGAVVGIGLGVFFGWAATSAVFDELVFGMPVGQIAAFIAVAILAGLGASVLPSRQAARTSITAALASE